MTQEHKNTNEQSIMINWNEDEQHADNRQEIDTGGTKYESKTVETETLPRDASGIDHNIVNMDLEESIDPLEFQGMMQWDKLSPTSDIQSDVFSAF